MRRREFLAVAGTTLFAGCTSLSSIDESTPVSSFPPATDVWHVTPPYPFRFDGEVTVLEGEPIGWLLSDIHPKRAHASGEILDGGPVSIYFSEEQIKRARVPTSTIETVSAESTFEATVEYPDGGGSMFIDADQRTTVDLQVEIERT